MAEAHSPNPVHAPDASGAEETGTSGSALPEGADWRVCRIDDNGNPFVVRDHIDRREAGRIVAEFEARGHKQVYWAERETK